MTLVLDTVAAVGLDVGSLKIEEEVRIIKVFLIRSPSAEHAALDGLESDEIVVVRSFFILHGIAEFQRVSGFAVDDLDIPIRQCGIIEDRISCGYRDRFVCIEFKHQVDGECGQL